jgi:hypothetical protein
MGAHTAEASVIFGHGIESVAADGQGTRVPTPEVRLQPLQLNSGVTSHTDSPGFVHMSSAERPENWLRLDEIEDAIDSLEMCGVLLAMLRDSVRWKWAIMALHQALYGFAISAVQGTDSLSVLQNRENPDSKLISIWEALKRARDSRYVWPGAAPLVTTAAEERAIERLSSEFRNGFEHFRPASWSIEVSGMPKIFHQVLRVVEFVALESGGIRYSEPHYADRVREALASIRAELSD